MNRFAAIFLLALTVRLAADEPFNREDAVFDNDVSEKSESHPPKLDPKRVINESNAFLKEREPEMNAEEFALYEKVITLLGTNPELAVRLLEAMMNDKEPPSPAFEFILGNAYYNSNQIDKAETRYLSSVKRYPTFIRAWNNLGVLYYTAGRYADAVPCFSKSVVLGDHDPMTFGLLGYCLEKGEDYISAELAFMQALGGDPNNTDWKEGLLRICMEGNQYARAEALVKKLIKDHPQESRYWLTEANILLAENRKVEAMVLLEAASATTVAGPDELTLLGDLYVSQHLPTEAIATYWKLREISAPAGEKRLLTLAEMLTTTGKLREAQEVLTQLEPQITPASRVAYLQARANWFFAQKQWPETRRELEALLRLAPFNGRAHLTLGRTCVAQDDLAHAAFAFEAAARAPETKYLASLELANLELKNRHYAKSVEYLEQALAIERTDAVEDYLARVKTLVTTNDAPPS
jgi:tetratricopeptide (TPR) repeat protein